MAPKDKKKADDLKAKATQMEEKLKKVKEKLDSGELIDVQEIDALNAALDQAHSVGASW